MSRLQNLEYRAEFLRGWPQEGALDLNYATDDATITNGDLVKMVAGAKVAKVSAPAGAGKVGIVVRGPADDKSVRVTGGIAAGDGTKVVGGGNKCIVLWGHYVVRTDNFKQDDVFAPGDEVYVNASATLAKGAGDGSTPVLGHVLEVDTLADGKKALVVLVR